MQTPDPEFTAEDKNEVEITDLDSPSKTDKLPTRPASGRKVRIFRTRTWMSIAIIVGIALLVLTVLLNVAHVPKAPRVTVQPVQINYPVSLSVVDGISLWSRSLPTNSPGTFQLTVSNKVVYVMSGAESIDVLRADTGILLWHRAMNS